MARFAGPGAELRAPDGSLWPPAAAYRAEADQLAGGHWLLGGEEFGFVPRLPGDHLAGEPEDAYLLPVVADVSLTGDPGRTISVGAGAHGVAVTVNAEAALAHWGAQVADVADLRHPPSRAGDR